MMQQGKSDMGQRVSLLGKVRISLSLVNFEGSCMCVLECAFTTIIVCVPSQYGSRSWCRMRVGVSGREYMVRVCMYNTRVLVCTGFDS